MLYRLAGRDAQWPAGVVEAARNVARRGQRRRTAPDRYQNLHDLNSREDPLYPLRAFARIAGERVQVMLRCRPLSDVEVAEGRENVVTVNESAESVTLQAARLGDAGARDFSFDAVFGPSCPQQKVNGNSDRVCLTVATNRPVESNRET